MSDNMELCYRCNKEKTAKRVDGKPVCLGCFLKDAKDNKDRAMDYSGLKPPAKSSGKKLKTTGKAGKPKATPAP